MEDMYLDQASKPTLKRLSKLLKIISISSFILILGVCVVPLKVMDLSEKLMITSEGGFIFGAMVVLLALAHLAVILLFCLPVWKAYKMHKYLDMLIETGDFTLLSPFFKNLTHILFFFLVVVFGCLAVIGFGLFMMV